MSELSETIERLEQWADYWEDHQPAEFIADLRALINTAKNAVRAVEVLQGLESVTVTMDDYEAAIAYARAVDHAVAILQEGQQ